MVGDSVLSSKFQKALVHLQQLNAILVSPISVWEISLLVHRKRIELEMDCLDWIERALACPGVQLAPLSAQIAVLSTRLPGAIHGDPADRILIATAFDHHAVLVTCDEKILHYGKDPFVNVYDPRA
jgi:PIN domain nuclease of toxin-antitoxin system